jgi:hypothetical protein
VSARIIVPLDVQLRAVEQREAVDGRAESYAASMTPGQLARLEREFQRNPTLPADALLAGVSDPSATSELFDNLALAEADMPRDFMQGDVVEAQMWRRAWADEEARIRREMSAGYGQAAPRSGFGGMVDMLGQLPLPVGINGNRTLGDYVSSAGRMLPAGVGEPLAAAGRIASDGLSSELGRYGGLPGGRWGCSHGRRLARVVGRWFDVGGGP